MLAFNDFKHRERERDFGERTGVPGQGGMASDWKKVELDGILGRNSWLGGWEQGGIELPEKLWLTLDPWQCPRPGWTGLGAAWDSGRCPCHGRGGAGWDGIWASKPQHFGILGFFNQKGNKMYPHSLCPQPFIQGYGICAMAQTENSLLLFLPSAHSAVPGIPFRGTLWMFESPCPHSALS